MKNILISANILFLMVGLFRVFNFEQEPCTNKFCKDYSSIPFTGTISPSTAVKLSRDYRNDNHKMYIYNGNTPTSVKDASSIWFSLDKIKKFIWEIEYRNCLNGCNDSLGIRIYYGRYPDRRKMNLLSELAGVNPMFENHHTIFMVPTYWEKNRDRNIDFNILTGCRTKFINAQGDSTLNASIRFFMAEPSRTTEYQNHGGIAPPPSIDGGFPTQ